MRWEYELMRDMLERAAEYGNVQTFECMKISVMLRKAVNVMTQWDIQIVDLQIQIKEKDAIIESLKEARK